jgi:hypothetical protein
VIEVQVDQQQLQKILVKLSPKLYEEAVKKMMSSVAHQGRYDMMNAIRGGTTLAVQTIHEKATATTAEVYSIMQPSPGMKIEEGRKPGDTPSLIQVARWQKSRGTLTTRRLNEFTREEVNQFREIQSAIKARGSKAKNYLQKTREKMQLNVNGYMSKIVNEIKENWRR